MAIQLQGDKGLQHIAEALITNTTLTELNLSACELRITEENGPALTEINATENSKQNFERT